MPTSTQGIVKILVLAARPPRHTEARIQEEFREIRTSIQASRHRDDFAVVLHPATRPRDVLDALREHRPDIVHFCGHGQDGQLFLHDDEGDAQPVSPASLARMFQTTRHKVRLVVFNVCESQRHAEAVIEHVDCAIAAGTTIDDRAAVAFSQTFYRALGDGEPVGLAFEQAVASLGAAGLAMPGAPDLRCLSLGSGPDSSPSVLFLHRPENHDRKPSLRPMQARQIGHLRAWRWYAAALAVIAVAAGSLALFWPASEFPRFGDNAGIVLVAPQRPGQDERQALAHLESALQGLGAHYVHTIKQPLAGASDGELVQQAKKAGASLVARIEHGPSIRILAIPGTRGSEFVASIPPLSLVRAETRETLAPILFALAWSAVKEPSALAVNLDLSIPAAEQVGPRLAVLAIYLRHLVDPGDSTWDAEAKPALARIIKQCPGEESLDQWFCGMAYYLYYGLMCPDCAGADNWLRAVSQRSVPVIGDAAMIDLWTAQCPERPDWVARELQHWNGQLGMRDCRRLAMSVPASCLVIDQGRREQWLATLAAPRLDEFAHCGDMRERVLAQRATQLGAQGRWDEAARTYYQAMELAPANPAHTLDWVAALLQIQPRPADLADKVARNLDLDRMDEHRRMQAEFLWWLVSEDHARAKERLCRLYDRVAEGRRAIPRLGRLGDQLCADDSSSVFCQVYGMLSAPRRESSAVKLCKRLGMRLDTARAAAGNHKQHP